MNYYWMYTNDADGTLAPQHSTQAPYDAAGKFDASLLPTGNTLLGVYDDSGKNNMPTEFQTAYEAPQAYLYQNGAYVSNPNYAAWQLQQAVTKQIASIEAGYDATINAGFQFTTGTNTYTMGWREDATYHDQLHLSQVQQAIDKGVETFPVEYADINGNTFSIPDQTTLTALDTTATSFGWAQVKQLRSLIGQVKTLAATSGTTVADIEAVVWSAAPY